MTFNFNLSENIFEVIGDYPVVDQFDVLYTNLLTGSMQDHYVTGSMFIRKTINGKERTFLGKDGSRYIERGRAFSKLGVPIGALPSISGSLRRSSEYQPWRERANFVKILRIFSNSERVYDSMTPRLSEMLTRVGSSILWDFNVAGNPYGYVEFSEGFNIRFPFEPIYSNIQRTKNLAQSFVGTPAPPPASASTSDKNKIFQTLSIYDTLVDDLGSIINQWYWQDSTFLIGTDVFDGCTTTDISKIFFGFGDSTYQNLYASFVGTPKIGKSSHRPVVRNYDISHPDYDIGINPVIRGWKYGLYNGLPHYTSAVYRRNKFGQFRDMLEQRQVIVSKIDFENSPNKFLESESPIPVANTDIVAEEKDSIENFVVRVSFVQQSFFNARLVYSNQDPVNTWSSNLSNFVTSSLPYFDGKQTNRPSSALTPP